MRTALAIPYADVDAGSLTWSTDPEPLPAVGVREVVLPAGTVELRLLGASHQVLLREPGRAGVGYSEVVACLPGGTPLPPRAAGTVDGLRYEFEAAVETPGEAFADRVRAVAAGTARHPGGLVGAYPGSPLAITALLAEPVAAGVRWRTWHAYPQTGELVRTGTTVGRVR